MERPGHGYQSHLDSGMSGDQKLIQNFPSGTQAVKKHYSDNSNGFVQSKSLLAICLCFFVSFPIKNVEIGCRPLLRRLFVCFETVVCHNVPTELPAGYSSTVRL